MTPKRIVPPHVAARLRAIHARLAEKEKAMQAHLTPQPSDKSKFKKRFSPKKAKQVFTVAGKGIAKLRSLKNQYKGKTDAKGKPWDHDKKIKAGFYRDREKAEYSYSWRKPWRRTQKLKKNFKGELWDHKSKKTLYNKHWMRNKKERDG